MTKGGWIHRGFELGTRSNNPPDIGPQLRRNARPADERFETMLPTSDRPWLRVRTEHRARFATAPVLVLLVAFAQGVLRALFEIATSPPIWVIVAAEVAVVGIAIAVWRGRRASIVTVTAEGVRPSRWRSGLVPAAHVDGVVLRSWTWVGSDNSGDVWVSPPRFLSLRLTDGRYAMLRAVERAAEAWRQPGRVYLSTSEHPDWAPLRDRDGRVIRWSAGNDDLVAKLIDEAFSRVLDPSTTPADSSAADLDLPCLSGIRERRLYVWPRFNAGFVTSDPPEMPPRPQARPSTAMPHWGALGHPVRYWTLASQREPQLLGRHPWLGFTDRGVILQRHVRRRSVPYSRVDRFDIVLKHRDGVDGWELMLVLTDGSARPLTGLSHGHFASNQLFWATAGRPTITGNGATGAMALGNDDADVLAARLNAQLELARAREPQQAPYGARLASTND